MTAIDTKYAAFGGPGGWLGSPVQEERVAADGTGAYRHYQNGSIFWHPSTGAFEVHGAIRDLYSRLGWERSFLGYPTTDESAALAANGRYNHFQGGSIYWSSATGAHEVHGAIRQKWADLAWEKSILGFPTSDELSTPDGRGRYNTFQYGTIYWSATTGAHEVHGAILAKFQSLRGVESVLGFPTTDETPTPDTVGRYNHFENGSIYWSPTTGAHEVHGAIRAQWAAMGWETSILGYPTTDETLTPDTVGRFNHFQNGSSIYWTQATGAHEVYGAIYQLWSSLGWERSTLGYPTSGEISTPHGGGRLNHFQHGDIYWDPGRGAYEVWPRPAAVAADNARDGRWEIPAYNSGVVGVHMALLHTNQVLFFTYREAPPGTPEGPQPNGDSRVLELSSGTVRTPTPAAGELNLFCAHQAHLADGRVFVGGGERQQIGVKSMHVFTPVAAGGGSWQRLADLSTGRWYPTCVPLPDGRVMIIGGRNWTNAVNDPVYSYEIFNPATGALAAPQASPVLSEAGADWITFPFAFALPDNRVFVHAGVRTGFLDLSTGAWSARFNAVTPSARTYGFEGTAVLLPLRPDDAYRARVMLIGGGTGATMSTPATNTCEILDTGAATPAWRLTTPMTRPRVMPDSVLLPDGTVFVTNGSATGHADNGANPVYAGEIFDPRTERWTTVAMMTVPRLYHATAILLPDGRVLTAGTDQMWNPDPFHEAQLQLEIFSPPYLFRGPRPSISSAPANAGFGASITVQTPEASSIDEVVLVRTGSSTHSFNSDQRLVGLSITSRASSSVTVQTPPNGRVAPPGYYLLFVVRDGIPSLGKFIRIG